MVIAIRAHNHERQNGIVNQKNRDETWKMPAETINLIGQILSSVTGLATSWLDSKEINDQLLDWHEFAMPTETL